MQCVKCGSEFTPEQRFCRKCGLPTAESTGAIAPTQMMPDAGDLPQRSANTAPQKPVTNPVANPVPQRSFTDDAQGQPTRMIDAQPTDAPGFNNGNSTNPFYQPPGYHTQAPPPAMYTAPPPYYTPPTKSGAPWAWILALGAIFLVGVIFFMALLFGRASRRRGGNFPPTPPTPTAPTIPGRPPTAPTGVLSDAGATITDDETTITQKFPLTNTSKFSLRNPSGNITIEGTDGNAAEIKVIKQGGDADDRKAVEIRYSTSGGNLTLETNMNNADDIDVSYQIKLPRSLGGVRVEGQSADVKLKNIDANIEIRSQSGKVDLTKVMGAVNVETQSGDISVEDADSAVRVASQSGEIELTDVKGKVDASSTSSTIKASFDSTPSDGMNFTSVSGDVDLAFNSKLNAEFEAQTVSGSMDVKTLGVEVKHLPGNISARGSVGTGGQSLKIKTISGTIKVSK